MQDWHSDIDRLSDKTLYNTFESCQAEFLAKYKNDILMNRKIVHFDEDDMIAMIAFSVKYLDNTLLGQEHNKGQK